MTKYNISGRRRNLESLAHVDLRRLDRLRSVVKLLRKDDAVSALLAACNSIGEAYLFGGLVRDALLGSSGVFGDVDIFVSGPLSEDVAGMVSRASLRTNFGGMRLVVGKFDVDIWELSKSRVFRLEKGRERNIKGLLSSVCFSTDAVAVSLAKGRVLADPSFNRTIKRGIFEFVRKPLGLEILQAVRIARITLKNDVKPDQEVSNYFVSCAEKFGLGGLLAAESKWKGRRLLDERLLGILFEWCSLVRATGAVEEAPIFGGDLLFPVLTKPELAKPEWRSRQTESEPLTRMV
ncbi:MAG: hypothetical protein ACYCZD_13670 [Rhodanobacter sp.]